MSIKLAYFWCAHVLLNATGWSSQKLQKLERFTTISPGMQAGGWLFSYLVCGPCRHKAAPSIHLFIMDWARYVKWMHSSDGRSADRTHISRSNKERLKKENSMWSDDLICHRRHLQPVKQVLKVRIMESNRPSHINKQTKKNKYIKQPGSKSGCKALRHC